MTEKSAEFSRDVQVLWLLCSTHLSSAEARVKVLCGGDAAVEARLLRRDQLYRQTDCCTDCLSPLKDTLHAKTPIPDLAGSILNKVCIDQMFCMVCTEVIVHCQMQWSLHRTQASHCNMTE